MQEEKKIHQKFSVKYDYDVLFTQGIFDLENNLLTHTVSKNGGNLLPYKILFMIERNVIKHFPDLQKMITEYCTYNKNILAMSTPPEIINGGESFKSFDRIEKLCSLFAKNKLCRHSFVAIIGGGAILDSVGMAASLVHRGIRQIRIPTTSLSQCDSGVGVKTSINMFNKKNFIGTFAPPYAVINDCNFLKSLKYRDWISSVPEAIKVAMINDVEFFEWIIQNSANFAKRDMHSMKKLIAHCAKLHLKHIATSGDPFEFGSARPLDFGHWAAHKLEICTNGVLRHGEAVGIGILLDSYYATQTGHLDEEIFKKLLIAYKRMRLPIYVPELSAKKTDKTLLLLDGIEDFREHLGGELHITMPDQLGNKIEISEINTNILIKGIEVLKQEYSKRRK